MLEKLAGVAQTGEIAGIAVETEITAGVAADAAMTVTGANAETVIFAGAGVAVRLTAPKASALTTRILTPSGATSPRRVKSSRAARQETALAASANSRVRSSARVIWR